MQLDNKSTPGLCCLNRYGTTIGDVLGFDGLKYDPERIAMFRCAVESRVGDLLSGVEADDINVFVKHEPHTLKKMREGRYRLISAVSMVDTMVDRMLFGALTDKVLSSVGRTPIFIGWTPLFMGYKIIRKLLPGKVLCIDKSSWDWTVPYWLIDMIKKVIIGLADSPSDWWISLVNSRFDALFKRAIFQFEDGTRIAQGVDGIMKSGCYLTILINSIGQLLLHYVVMMKLGKNPSDCEPCIIGDDTVQDSFPFAAEYVAMMKRLGFKIKESVIQPYIEFAGFNIMEDRFFPAYYEKHIYNLTHADEKVLPDLLASYQMLYVHERGMLKFVQDTIHSYAPDRYVPRELLRAFVDGNISSYVRL